MTKKRSYITAVLSIVMCALCLCGCVTSPLDTEWKFETLIKDGRVAACAQDVAERHPDAEVLDVEIALNDGKITVSSDGETAEGIYENLDPYRVTEENFIVRFGGNECRMTIAETVYADGSTRPTLVLSGRGFAAYFYGKEQ